jgi:tripartite-type tricarboxylate transporter receptor subunit TctC
MLRRRHLLLAGAVAAPARLAAQAPWRPDRPIRAIVPFAAGGLADLTARLVAEPAGALLGQPIVVENRTGGAGGLIGTDLVAKSPADGSTILINSSAQAIAPALVSRMPYDAAGDFAGLAMLSAAPMVIVCHPAVPARTMAELVALLRASPGRLNFAGAGIGSTVHLTGEVFRAAVGAELPMVHYRGGGPALQAVMAGETQITGVTPAEAAPHIRAGTVRAMAVGGPARSLILPEVPTAAEAGLPAFRQDIWIIAAAPARTPAPVIAAYAEAFGESVERLAPRLAELGLAGKPGVVTPAQVDGFIRSEIARYAAVLRAAGVQPE